MSEMSLYEQLSAERKQKQAEGLVPDWMTTGGWQLFKEKVQFDSDGYLPQVKRVADELATVAPKFLKKSHPMYKPITKNYGTTWKEVFYNLFAKGHLAPSSPLIANGGTNRGCTVSCAGSEVPDSVYGFYDTRMRAALLTKEGFGTSAYLGGIRPRGSDISGNGKATGSWPVAEMFFDDAKKVSQGSTRRGSVACYLDIDHDDFDEWCDNLLSNPEGKNIGWNISKVFIKKLEEGDEEADRRYCKALYTKMITGKGYFWKIDHVNEQQPITYKDRGLLNKASNLCSEIVLFAGANPDADADVVPNLDYTCVLSSMNAYFYDEWEKSGAIFAATVLLDCNAELFIRRGEKIRGMEGAVAFTRKSRALGLGVLGFHSYLQRHMMPFESMEAHMFNNKLFKQLNDESLMASQWMAEVLGEPEWCVGYGVRNTHRCAIAPNMSSATLAGQRSQGIEPIISNAFIQASPAGEMQRINPEFLTLAKERGKYTKRLIKDVINNWGSVQHLKWLTEHEKAVFKTAFEIDQRAILRMASARQRHIDQCQSLNFFFSADESEEYIAAIHKEMLLDPYIKGAYYVRSSAGVQASKDECVACEG